MTESRKRKIIADKSDGDRVRVSISRKINLAKYDMLEMGISSTVSVEPGETVKDAIQRIAKIVRAEHADILEVVREDAEI